MEVVAEADLISTVDLDLRGGPCFAEYTKHSINFYGLGGWELAVEMSMAPTGPSSCNAGCQHCIATVQRSREPRRLPRKQRGSTSSQGLVRCQTWPLRGMQPLILHAARMLVLHTVLDGLSRSICLLEAAPISPMAFCNSLAPLPPWGRTTGHR